MFFVYHHIGKITFGIEIPHICNVEAVTTIPEPLLFFCRFCA